MKSYLTNVTRVKIAAVMLSSGAMMSSMNLEGLYGAILLASCVLVLPTPFAFAVGQGTIVPLLSTHPILFLIAELGITGLLAAPLFRRYRTGKTLVIASAWSLFFGALVVIVTWTRGQHYTLVATLVGFLLLTMYGLHRYELVQLGLVEGEDHAQ